MMWGYPIYTIGHKRPMVGSPLMLLEGIRASTSSIDSMKIEQFRRAQKHLGV